MRNANIVAVNGVFFDQKEKSGCLIMPFYPGGDLSTWLQKNHPDIRDQAVCKQIASDILNGLVTIHSHGHVHCDLKPSNIFLTQTNRAVIGDFDGVKMEHGTITSNLQITPQYLAPELQDGDVKSVSNSVDMYAFGIILRELFPGSAKDGQDLIGLLISELPGSRPSARSVLAHPFFSITPETVHDCVLCFDKVLASNAVACGGGHGYCSQCFDSWLSLGAPEVSPNDDVQCSVQGCPGLILGSEVVRISEEAWKTIRRRVAENHEARTHKTKFKHFLFQ